MTANKARAGRHPERDDQLTFAWKISNPRRRPHDDSPESLIGFAAAAALAGCGSADSVPLPEAVTGEHAPARTQAETPATRRRSIS
jgi:hypothetical protein